MPLDPTSVPVRPAGIDTSSLPPPLDMTSVQTLAGSARTSALEGEIRTLSASLQSNRVLLQESVQVYSQMVELKNQAGASVSGGPVQRHEVDPSTLQPVQRIDLAELKSIKAQAVAFLVQMQILQQAAGNGGVSEMPAQMKAFLQRHGVQTDRSGNDDLHNKNEWNTNIGKLNALIKVLSSMISIEESPPVQRLPDTMATPPDVLHDGPIRLPENRLPDGPLSPMGLVSSLKLSPDIPAQRIPEVPSTPAQRIPDEISTPAQRLPEDRIGLPENRLPDGPIGILPERSRLQSDAEVILTQMTDLQRTTGRGVSAMPQEMKAFLEKNGIRFDRTGNDDIHTKDEWEVNISYMKSFVDNLVSTTKAQMTHLDATMSKFGQSAQDFTEGLSINYQLRSILSGS